MQLTRRSHFSMLSFTCSGYAGMLILILVYFLAALEALVQTQVPFSWMPFSLTPSFLRLMLCFCAPRYLVFWFKTTATSTATGTLSSLWVSGSKKRRLGFEWRSSRVMLEQWKKTQPISLPFSKGPCSVWDRHQNVDQGYQRQGTVHTQFIFLL